MRIMYSYLVSPLAATEVWEGEGRRGGEGRRRGEGGHYAALLFRDNLVWSGLDQDDMRIMYSYLVSPLAATEVWEGEGRRGEERRGEERRGEEGRGGGEGRGGHYVALLFRDNLVWSGLDQDDMRIMYSYLVYPLASTEV